jgi:hypothetical protein
MHPPQVGSLAGLALAATVLVSTLGCDANQSGTAPSLVLRNEMFTGTLQPGGADAKSFTVAFTAAPTDLTATVISLATVANSTPVTGITIGVGFGLPAGTGGSAGTSCSVQLQSPATALGQVLSVPGGVNAGTYCVMIFDCPTGATGCTSMLTQPVTYTMSVKHY